MKSPTSSNDGVLHNREWMRSCWTQKMLGQWRQWSSHYIDFPSWHYHGPRLSNFRLLCFPKTDPCVWSPPATDSRSSFCPPDKVRYLSFLKTDVPWPGLHRSVQLVFLWFYWCLTIGCIGWYCHYQEPEKKKWDYLACCLGSFKAIISLELELWTRFPGRHPFASWLLVKCLG